MTPDLFEVVRDVRSLSALMLGGIGLIFLLSWAGREQGPSAWLAGSLIGLGVAQAVSVTLSYSGDFLGPVQRLMASAAIVVPTSAALFVGLRAYFLPQSRSPWRLFLQIMVGGLALSLLILGATGGWPFAGGVTVSVMGAMAAVWLLHLWRQRRWWGPLVLAGSMALIPAALLLSLFLGLSLDEYRQLSTYPVTFVCIELILLILIRDAQVLNQELKVRREAETALRLLAESLEDEVHKRTESLQEVVAGLQSFAAMVSHDLRGPVRNVKGLAAMALEEFRQGDASGTEQSLDLILTEARRGAAMVNDLLCLAQVENDKLQAGEIDMAQVMVETVQSLALQYPEAWARVEIGGMPKVVADAGLMRHVASNLIGNALKFGGGHEQLRVWVSARCDGQFWRFEIRDNGPGFDATLAHQLFKPFSRLGNTEVAGTGLGLTVVKRAVERQGGQAGASAELGSGSSFWWTLPAMGRPTGTALEATA
ncbi:ATP-binding protein [Hydrogenophaga sp.]|uniref:sensor histidine kinase n=1 Tax=Hydrogenophaga sp. TaxID=1904254 RepID=UPI00272FFA9D|nr:HAMP domain-containing sensor histidine kinase [Hydrogenophaga sp.]MDP1683620.1 HAMP domain-containing sensor histidine kinase [Hydrogenophaga sp.]